MAITESRVLDHRPGRGAGRRHRDRRPDHGRRLGGRRAHRARRRREPHRPARRRRHVRHDGRGPRPTSSPTRSPRIPGAMVRKVSDRTFLLHLGGKIEVNPKVPLKHRDDLSRAYTPGVARVCLAIAEHPEDARRLTIKRNTVAVVTDGSAVLGLGNIGPLAALPVMEGKAALFKQFGGVDAWPVCLDTQDTDAIVEIVRAIAPVYGGINLEDISAPRCFEIEARLRELLDIPVFHDDQHGTAIVVLAALKTPCASSTSASTTCASSSPASARPATPSSACCSTQGAARHRRRAAATVRSTRTARGWSPSASGSPTTPTRADPAAPSRRSSPAPTSSSASRRRTCSPATTSRRWPTARSSSPSPTPPRGRPDRRQRARGRRRHRSLRLPQPDQQRPRLPRLLPRPARRPRLRDHRRDDGRGCLRPSPTASTPGELNAELHHPQRLRRQRRPGGGRRRASCGGSGPALTMQTRQLGRTGRQVSVVGLGCWQLGADWGDVDESDAMARPPRGRR